MAQYPLVYAFECHPMTFSKLSKSIKINGLNNIIAVEAAISDVSGKTLELQQVNNNLGASYITATHLGMTQNIGVNYQVKTLALDDYEFKLNTDLIIIKLDIQGHENEAIRAMTKLLTNSKNRVILVELDPSSRKAEDVCALAQNLIGYGFNKMYSILQMPGGAWAGPMNRSLNLNLNNWDNIISELDRKLPTLDFIQIKQLIMSKHIVETMFIR